MDVRLVGWLDELIEREKTDGCRGRKGGREKDREEELERRAATEPRMFLR